MVRAAAWIFAGLSAGVVLFHLLVIAGAPWGAWTMGGRWPGVLPWPARGLSALSALMILGMAGVLLTRAGVLRRRTPRGAMGATLVLSGLAVLSNAATPSAPERALWLPVTLVMLAAAGVVARGHRMENRRE
jgi:hypothetical protein